MCNTAQNDTAFRYSEIPFHKKFSLKIIYPPRPHPHRYPEPCIPPHLGAVCPYSPRQGAYPRRRLFSGEKRSRGR